jgi:hypothetical protein
MTYHPYYSEPWTKKGKLAAVLFLVLLGALLASAYIWRDELNAMDPGWEERAARQYELQADSYRGFRD